MGEMVQQEISVVGVPERDHAGEDLDQWLLAGMVAFLEVSPKSGCEVRCKTIIRSWERDSFILVDKPKVKVRRSHRCALRFMRDGVVWGFYTFISDPSPDRAGKLMRLTWPKEIQHVHLRRYERVKVSIPCSFHLEDGSVHQAMVQDMSYGGCCILSDALLWEGMKIMMNLTLPDGIQIEELALEVKNRRPGNVGEGSYGCAFVDEKEAERSGMGMFINRIITMERGQAGGAFQVLLLTGEEKEATILQEAADDASLNIRKVNGVVDLFHHIRVHIPIAVFVNAVQRDMSALDICRILRGTQGIEAIQVVVYGGEAGQMQEKAIAAGASAYLDDLSDSESIQSFLSEK